ncbi:efflux RND transporter periplasmic adaptor subunit [Echinimonas agarilytica]|uniref:Efflux RND transporter periplasmic adaptor subunit n=1 Tax=Echinimonas agarilytica TaxID=1215918 RepID=A0AA42B7V1_9GAMM|nr:efflux RND transporter periplasmic adaptor subunit [Echinimonas agarilytica]MCM2679748.1 efflux RND transporter periplasmic adaptor subunit [Echinimonas agarilytica]
MTIHLSKPKYWQQITRPLLATSLLVALWGCDSSNQGAQNAPPPTVTVVEAKLADVRPTTGFTGRVEAIDSVELRARVEGYLSARLVNEGSDVQVGDLLFTIEKEHYQADVDKAKGAIKKLEGAKSLSIIERDRRAKLVKTKAIAQEQLDVAIANVTEADGDLLSQQAELVRAELNLSYTDVSSPISGRIGLSPFSVGDFVGPSSGSLATVVSQDPMYVKFPISQRQLLAVQKSKNNGDNADVNVKLQLADKSFYDLSGTIDFVDVEADPSTDTIIVRAKFANPDGILVHHQLVNVVIEDANPEQHIVIPQAAMQFDQVGKYVLLVDDTNKVVIQRIETGPTVNGNLVINQGLKEGDKVITLGVQKVRPGIEVNATITTPEGS